MAKPVQRLSQFGRVIANARRASSPPILQGQLAQALVGASVKRDVPASYDQSFVAKIEKGLITNPSRELLEMLSDVLSLNYGEVLGAVIADKYLGDERHHIAAVLRKGVLTLPELATWEGQEGHDEIWIVAEQFYDKDMPQLQDAVETILTRRCGAAVFFLNEENEFKFGGYRAELEERLDKDVSASLTFVPLKPEQSAVLVAPFVIANPKSASREGYVIMSDDRGPTVAIRMSETEAHHRMDYLRVVKANHLRSARSNSGRRLEDG